MARIDVTENVVVASFVTLLRAALDLQPENCYEVDDADSMPEIPIAGDWWVTVAGGDGMFEPGNQDRSQCSEETEIIVTAYTRIQTDITDHAEQLLHDPDRGLLGMKRKLLKALVGEDLTTTTGDTFLRNYVYAFRASRPTSGQRDGGNGPSGPMVGRISVVFRCSWDWRLTD